jgi:hypothetical protein
VIMWIQSLIINWILIRVQKWSRKGCYTELGKSTPSVRKASQIGSLCLSLQYRPLELTYLRQTSVIHDPSSPNGKHVPTGDEVAWTSGVH